jgi:hypothetical protein
MDQGRQVFSVDLLERYATKNRGMITCMAAGNDVIVLGTSKGWIIRYDFGVGSSNGICSFCHSFSFFFVRILILSFLFVNSVVKK